MGIMDKHNYLNKDIPYLINTPIREYDMKSGGFSILKKNNVFGDKELKLLENMDKYDKNVYIGKMIRKDGTLNTILMDGFIDARNGFAKYNNIREENVLSNKKDALFIIKQPARVLSFDGYEFQEKNKYTSYYYINGIEFYFNPMNNQLDTKGLGSAVVEQHSDYFLKDLTILFNLAEKRNVSSLLKKLVSYRDSYIKKELPLEHYREMNSDCIYRLKFTTALGSLGIQGVGQNILDQIDITYNYSNFIIPLINYYI